MLISSEIGVPFLKSWLRHHTSGMTGVVELGAGYFNKLSFLHPDVRWKAGIEIFQECHDKPEYTDCERIKDDMKNYRNHVNLGTFRCAMLIDSIEHIEKSDGINLLKLCQQDFDRVLVMTPDGESPQDEVYGNPYQRHRSTWEGNDLHDLGFQLILTHHYFHSLPNSTHKCLFARWDRK